MLSSGAAGVDVDVDEAGTSVVGSKVTGVSCPVAMRGNGLLPVTGGGLTSL